MLASIKFKIRNHIKKKHLFCTIRLIKKMRKNLADKNNSLLGLTVNSKLKYVFTSC